MGLSRWILLLCAVAAPGVVFAEGDFTSLLQRSKGRGGGDAMRGQTVIESASGPRAGVASGFVRNIVDVDNPEVVSAAGPVAVNQTGGSGGAEAVVDWIGGGDSGVAIPERGSSSVRVWQLDPRSAISADQFEGSPYEATELKVERSLLAAEFPVGAAADSEPSWKQKILISIPVVHRSRTLSWTKEDVAEARNLATRLKAHIEKSKALRAEAEGIIEDWQKLVRRGTPEMVLGVDSPSLTSNESDSALVRGSPEEGFEAGKGLIFNVIDRPIN